MIRSSLNLFRFMSDLFERTPPDYVRVSGEHVTKRRQSEHQAVEPTLTASMKATFDMCGALSI